MAQKLEVFKCDSCGHIVEILHEGGGDLVCCGKPMRAVKENTVEASREKHVPVVEKTAAGVKVTVGSIPHPMEEKHYIEWIELIADGRVLRQCLKPGAAPTALFEGVQAAQLTVREYCNLHGLWKA
jgi:superoxide reductase